MSGGTTQQSGTSTQINQIPQWMTDAGQQNYAFAQQVAQQPLQQYQGQMVADVSPQTQQSWNTAANSGNVGSDQYNAGTAGYLGALAQNPMQVSAGGPTMQVGNVGNAAGVTAGNIGQTDLSNYMNPYTQSVINATLPMMQQQNALSQNQLGNAANSSNAFGGSRQGIQQGVAQAQGAQNIGAMAAGLNQANFSQAQAAATGDINRQLQAATTNQASQQTDLARQQQANLANQSANAGDLNRALAANQGNQSAQQAKINSDIAASQGLTTTGDAMNRANVANFGMQQSAGAGQSMQAQNQINAQMAKFNQAFNYPQQQLGTLLSALGMTPHDTSQSGQTTQQTTTPTDWASIIKGGADVAGSMFPMGLQSDKTTKTDITKLGKDPKTGLPMYSFRYKDDPKTYPKVVGPMAQDIEKQYPGSTTPTGKAGKLAIRGYAAGTPFVQPSLAAFTPPSSPGVAKGISAMSAFRPPMRLPRGATMPVMPKRFAEGTSDVQPGPTVTYPTGQSQQLMMGPPQYTPLTAEQRQASPDHMGPMYSRTSGRAVLNDPRAAPFSDPRTFPAWKQFAGGTSQVPGFGSPDTVPAMLTPGEAVLTPGAAQKMGRPKIAALNAMMPPVGSRQATTMPRAGARGVTGALANTKLRPKVMGALGG